MKRGRIPDSSDPQTLKDVADSLDEDAKRYERFIQWNPQLPCAEQRWVIDSLHAHAKKLRRMARTIENKRARE